MSSAILDIEPDAVSAADRPHETPVRTFLTPSPSTFKNYSTCPWAETAVIRNHETGEYQVCAISCKRWGCSYCAPRKIRKLAFLTNGAAPNRWIRLGVNPRNYETPAEAWKHTSPLVPELFRVLRQKHGEMAYLRVCEIHEGKTVYPGQKKAVTAEGFPHYHALLRCGYLPVKELSQAWAALTALPLPKEENARTAILDLAARRYDEKALTSLISALNKGHDAFKTKWQLTTGAAYVWIAKIDQTFRSFRYLTKYLTKLHKMEWTDRHVSYSKNFFRGEDTEKMAYAKRDVIMRDKTHPWKFLADYFGSDQISVDEKGTWNVPWYPSMPETDIPLREFGLARYREDEPTAHTERPNPSLTQNHLPGLEDAEQPDYHTGGF